MQGSISQIFYLSPSLWHKMGRFSYFLHFIKSMLGHKKISETCFPAFRPSVHVLKMSFNFVEIKNNCQKCYFCVCKFNINSTVLLPNSVLYH